ncbi:T9SS type A sorting domain-containing protein [Fulvivirga sp. M361]|uniref:MBG domain-containing protein n=1 Tax=Fulvivirga sp. M361 TaxID=2594266 RepID=UPI001179B6B8|nr:MBG domain-containing protein [Fulvivirga sp. M361]TRX60073.1 T9SS type A sorting domain-containing protein [Fulvivirga sp. M361]
MLTRSIFCVFIPIFLTFAVNAQWTEQVLLTDQNLYDIAFVTENEGWAIGLEGTMLRYEGSEWKKEASLTGNSFNRITFTSDTEGWAITGEGKIFRYNGTEWSLNFSAGKALYTLHFLETGEGYVSGSDGYIAYYSGSEWTEGNIGFDVISLASYFSDNKNGWISSGAGLMYQFKDSVWSEINIAATGAFFEMDFIAPDNGYAVGFDNTIWHYDGNSWSLDYTSTTNTNQYLTDTYFLDEDHGWAGGQGTLFTYRYGVWQEEAINQDWEIWGFHFTDPFNGWAVGSDGLLLQYTDLLDWQPVNAIPSNLFITEISRGPNGDLYAIGHTENEIIADSEAGLYRSSDGLNWQKISSDLDLLARTNTILALDGVLLVSGMDTEFNTILHKSTDGGLTWTQSDTGLSEHTSMEDMAIDENGVVYAVANYFYPELYKSEDLGDTWTLITTSGFSTPTDVSEADFVNIAAIGTTLFVFHQDTENGIRGIYTSANGMDWTVLENTPDELFAADLHAGENGLLYASGAIVGSEIVGAVYASSDMGNSWYDVYAEGLGGIYTSITSWGTELFLSTFAGSSNERIFGVFTTLKPTPQSIDFGALLSKTYGDDPFELTASASSGLPVTYNSSNEEVAVIIDQSIHINAAGSSIITASQPGNDSFAAAGNIEQLLTVNKATLNVSVANVSRKEGEVNPDFAVSYSGWVNEDDVNDLDTKPVASTIADVSSAGGTYPITISGGLDNNYTFNYSEGILTVEVITSLADNSLIQTQLFPNPVHNRLMVIPGRSMASAELLVYNANGMVIHNKALDPVTTELDFTSYPNGVYLLKIISAEGIAFHRVIKE